MEIVKKKYCLEMPMPAIIFFDCQSLCMKKWAFWCDLHISSGKRKKWKCVLCVRNSSEKRDRRWNSSVMKSIKMRPWIAKSKTMCVCARASSICYAFYVYSTQSNWFNFRAITNNPAVRPKKQARGTNNKILWNRSVQRSS